jgi:cobyrinic acid a,c-diamide synthase
MPHPRLVIAAPQGRSGKTTITLGICAALAERGLQIQPFKKGPDYIDPSWLSEAAGQACRSLDPFFLGNQPALRQAFLRGARSADLSIIEGNHGLYDGVEISGSRQEGEDSERFVTGSSAETARSLACPVIMVINCTRMSRSAAAMLLGYQQYEPETNLAGVILNNVANSRHESKLRQAIEQVCRIPVIGAMPRREALTIPDRHLGLTPHAEFVQRGVADHRNGSQARPAALDACQEAAEKHLDLNLLLVIARSAPDLPVGDVAPGKFNMAGSSDQPKSPVKIGVLRDRAFTFYYPENLEALQEAGAELVFIDAFEASRLLEIQALVIGGGFPEIYMEELSANGALRKDIYQAISDGMPVYAECGGLMYLSQRIHWGERSTEMVGALPVEVEMTSRPAGHGYVLAKTTRPSPFFPTGTELRGHEFHHSRLCHIQKSDNLPVAYHLERGHGLGQAQDGLVYRNVLAGYTHLHCDGAPGWATGVVASARQSASMMSPNDPQEY